MFGFDSGFYAEASADTPDLLETALDKPEYSPGDTMVVAVTARTAGKVMLNIIADRLITTISQDVQPGINQIRVPVGRDWGNGGYVVATLAAAARCRGPAHARPRHRRAVVLDRPQGEDARGQSRACPPLSRPSTTLARAGQDRRASPAKRRASSSPRSMSASSI